jgi:hypothetical protein
VTAPAFDHHLGLAQAVEDLAVQQMDTSKNLSPRRLSADSLPDTG